MGGGSYGTGIMIAKMMGQHLEAKVDQSLKNEFLIMVLPLNSNYRTPGQFLSSDTFQV